MLDWNLHYGVSSTPSVDLDQVAATIRDSGAQVVTLQEVSRGWVLGGGVDTGSYLARATGLEMAFVGAADRQFGNAILWNPDAVTATDVARLALPWARGRRTARRSRRRSPRRATDRPGPRVRVTSVHLQHREGNTRPASSSSTRSSRPSRCGRLPAGGRPQRRARVGGGHARRVARAGQRPGPGRRPGDLTSPADAPSYRIDWVFGSGVAFTSFAVLDDVSSDHRPLVTVVRPAAPSDGEGGQSWRWWSMRATSAMEPVSDG
ncbi:hypothetical protein NKG05_23800 [Oerskovia sp. M15]